MANLKVPSLQHLARTWRPDPLLVKRTLVRLATNPPTFSYAALIHAVRDMLIFSQPYEEIVEGIRKGVKRRGVRENFLSVLPLLRDHFEGVSPKFVQAIERRHYPIGRGLLVPFEPPLFYGVEGKVYFPWFIFWRENPIARERLSLFVTIVEEMLLQDPDLESARFEILDFSASHRNRARELTVLDACEIPRVTNERRNEMLSIYVEGYLLAQAELAGSIKAESEGRDRDDARKGGQPGLFDGDQ